MSLSQMIEKQQRKIYTDNQPFLEKSLIYLENLELQFEGEKISRITDNTIPIAIRKSKYLKKISSLEELNQLILTSNKYYSYDKTLSGNQEENTYEYDVNDNVIENFYSNFIPTTSLFNLINKEYDKGIFKNLIKELSKNFPNEKEKLEEIEKFFFTILAEKNIDYPKNITRENKCLIVSSTLKNNQYGVFFRTVHRIIKITLSFSSFLGIINRKKLSKYCGILRTQLSEEQLLLLYYNAQFTERGKKFKVLVQQVNLWGDIDELTKTDSQDLTHFKYNSLIWPESDLAILRKEYIK